jgi:hypothetical protein
MKTKLRNIETASVRLVRLVPMAPLRVLLVGVPALFVFVVAVALHGAAALCERLAHAVGRPIERVWREYQRRSWGIEANHYSEEKLPP